MRRSSDRTRVAKSWLDRNCLTRVIRGILPGMFDFDVLKISDVQPGDTGDDVLGFNMLAGQRAHHHRIGEEHRRELLADRNDLVVCARGDLAQQRDAAKDCVDLLDLLVEPLHERFEEIELLLDETHSHVFVTLPHTIDDLVDAIPIARARGLGSGDEIVRHARERGNDDDRIQLAPLGHDVDRIRHALRVADRGAAEFDDNHGLPPDQWISGLVISGLEGTPPARFSNLLIH